MEPNPPQEPRRVVPQVAPVARTVTMVSRHRSVTEAQADAAYSILIEHAGARDDADSRHTFVRYVSAQDGDEYRFQGRLGFGGKFRNNGNNDDVPHVDCYPEHLDASRAAIIAMTNERLRALFGPAVAP